MDPPLQSADQQNTDRRFVSPLRTTPLELEARLAAVPAEQKTKGIFFAAAVAEVKRRRCNDPLVKRRYTTFRGYPTRDFMELLVLAAEAAYPKEPVREGLRNLGRAAFKSAIDSTLGRVYMAVAKTSWPEFLQKLGEAYGGFTEGDGATEEIGDASAVIRIRKAWAFPDCYHVGILEEAMQTFRIEGQVTVYLRSFADADLRVVWKDPAAMAKAAQEEAELAAMAAARAAKIRKMDRDRRHT